MRIKAIEIEGEGGHLAIERDGDLIRIRSTIRQRDQYVTKRWDLEPTVNNETLFAVATEVQRRTDGQRGSNSMIHDYFNYMQRFQA